jgi:hypothetical protein
MPRLWKYSKGRLGHFGRIDRLKFLDTFKLFGAIDYKNSLEPNKRIAIGRDQAIDNDYLAANLVPELPFLQTGRR